MLRTSFRGVDGMELSTIFGLIVGVAAMLGVLAVGETHFSVLQLIDLPALIMVFGGAISVALVGFPLKDLVNLFAILKKPFFTKPNDRVAIIDELVELADRAKKEGMLALEARAFTIRDPFTALGIQLLADETRPELVAQILNDEVDALATRHREAKRIVDLIGRCGPAFGMIATLLGLVLMMGNLKNPDSIGPSMAIALMGTFYGIVLAYLVCIPLGEKLRFMSCEEVESRQIVIRGILAIQAGDMPRLVRQKLDASLPPRLRLRISIHSGTQGLRSAVPPAHFASRKNDSRTAKQKP